MLIEHIVHQVERARNAYILLRIVLTIFLRKLEERAHEELPHACRILLRRQTSQSAFDRQIVLIGKPIFELLEQSFNHRVRFGRALHQMESLHNLTTD